MVRHAPVEDVMLRFSTVIPLLPSITIGPAAVSKVGCFEVAVAEGVGVVVALGLGLRSRHAAWSLRLAWGLG